MTVMPSIQVRSSAKNNRSVFVYSRIMNGAMQEHNIVPADLLLYKKSFNNSIPYYIIITYYYWNIL